MLAQYFHSATDENQAAEALKRVGLGERLTHLPSQLSGGEQQRVAIARALINQPKLILADEPTGNLDEANEQIVIDLFRELHKSGHTILMVTHDPDIARQADRRIELAHGHLSFDTAQHGPNHPMACPLANTADCCTPIPADDEIRVDHLLEQIWICGEEGKPAQAELLRVEGPAGPASDRWSGARDPLAGAHGRLAADRVQRHEFNDTRTDGAATNGSAVNGSTEVQLTEPARSAHATWCGVIAWPSVSSPTPSRSKTPKPTCKPAASSTSSPRNSISVSARSSVIRKRVRTAIRFRRGFAATRAEKTS